MRLVLLAALWTHLVALVLLVGTFSTLLLAGPPATPTARRWDATAVAWARRLALVALGAGLAWLLARTALFENRPHAALEPAALARAALDTWPGLVWLARHAMLVVLAAFLAVRVSVESRGAFIAARGEGLLLAALALVLASASSHAAAIAPGTALAVAVDAAHLLGTGVWVGGLLPLALLLRAAARDDGADARPAAVVTARRFSRVALVTVLVLMATGVANALAQVETVASLVGTTHGRLLLAKLALLVPIMGLAAVGRRRLLPSLDGPRLLRQLGVVVGLEAALAVGVLGLAAAMTLTIPARHDEPVWPLPFRLSLDALADGSAMRGRAWLGGQLAVAGAAALVVALLVRRRRAAVVAGAVALVALAAGVGLPPLLVEAYPTTYKRPLLTYHATSIAAGNALYAEHCAGCHGPAGAGEGRLADLRSPPASRRRAGELFWLVGHGRPARGMPAFANRLAESQRWDVINFLRALAAADGARTIGRDVEPDRPWLVAPDFTVTVGPLAPGALRDYRGRRIVLVVLYTLPASRARLTELARRYPVLSVLGVEVIAVPTQVSPDAIAELESSPPILFPVVTAGARDVLATYRLFARGPHAEILVDRQGYVRAIRDDAAGDVRQQVEILNAEKAPPPFPDDHVH